MSKRAVGCTVWIVNSGVKLELLRGGQAEGSRLGLRSIGVCACSPYTPQLLQCLLFLLACIKFKIRGNSGCSAYQQQSVCRTRARPGNVQKHTGVRLPGTLSER